MPIYDFQCVECGKEFELIVGVSKDNSNRICPQCNSTNIKKLLSSFAVRGGRSNSSCDNCVTNNCSSCK